MQKSHSSDWCLPCPSQKSTTIQQGALGVPPQKKGLEEQSGL